MEKCLVVQLSAGSFAGLVTVGLYLHDCSLTDISAGVLAPLNTTLRYLWLNGNELDGVDASLAGAFATLHHLRLGSNPLRCDCAAAWLRSFLDAHADLFRGALPPSCFRPRRLRGRRLSDVDAADLRCRPPSFTALDARLDGRGARLRCAAIGDPSPTLYWVEPSGRTTRYDRPSTGGGGVEHVEAVLELTQHASDVDGLYTCVANNDVGNVTLTVFLPSQPRPPSVANTINPTTTTAPLTDVPVTPPAVLQSIMLGDSLLQLQRLHPSGVPSPPSYSLITQMNRSTSHELGQQQVPVTTSSRERSVLPSSPQRNCS